jgi:3-dehydroquinate synthase II
MKEIIVKPDVTSDRLDRFIEELRNEGVVYVYHRDRIVALDNSLEMHILSSIDDVIRAKSNGSIAGLYVDVKSKEDEDLIVEAVAKGAEFVVVDARDWKIIPLENIIAKVRSKAKVYAYAKDSSEVRTLFNVLQLGVDGVILNTSSIEEVRRSMVYMHSKEYPLEYVKVIKVMDSGLGERVCVDTASILKIGEGMLIGSKANFLFLMHNEAIGSEFTSPRPFRVNAGAVHCYTLMPNGSTKYLSEIESGDEVLIVNREGKARDTIVGRVKIESRPMRVIKAISSKGEEGSIIVQNAETIRFIGREGLIPVTSIKEGDEVLAYIKGSRGRHFGIEVDEFILEK